MSDRHMLELPDGRQLCWSEQGDPAGSPVLTLHGSPGSRLSRHPDAGQVRRAGIRQITYDRPGYGRSDPLASRTVADAAGDIAAVLDAAGVERAAVVGGSGGGPHALAAAALLSERCTVVHCVAGVAPYGAEGLAFFEGMDEQNVRRFRAASSGRGSATAVLGPDLAAAVAAGQNDPTSLAGGTTMPEADLAVLRLTGRHIHASFVEASRQGATGLVDDYLALTSAWGFDPAYVRAPVVIHLGMHDVNVPPSHGRWLVENVPHQEARIRADSGHLATPDQALALLIEAAGVHAC